MQDLTRGILKTIRRGNYEKVKQWESANLVVEELISIRFLLIIMEWADNKHLGC